MKDAFMFIGCIVFAAFLMAIPMVWIYSFICRWDDVLKFILTPILIAEYIVLCYWLYFREEPK